MARPHRALAALVIIAAIAVALFLSKRTGNAPSHPANTAANTPARGGELVTSVRTEPTLYNRYVDAAAAGELLALLTQAPLVRVDRTTDTLEPWLAESWTESPDGLSYTLKLRDGVTFSDGVPLTSADVLFSFRALYDPRSHAVLANDTLVGGKPLVFEAPDAATVIVRLPAPFAPGLRLIDGVPILPRHKLQAAFDAGKFNEAWSATTPLTEIAGLGPFVLTEHASGQRLVFSRNPHYWRKDSAGVQLPYLDTLTALVIPDQNTEALRMSSGEIDLMANGEIRPEDYATFRRVSDQGRVRMIDGGVGLDPNLLWFNLSPSRAADPRNPWLRNRSFRQAVSCAIDRQAMANAVYLGAAVPIYGPITPGNRTWYTPIKPPCDADPARARALFESVGLADRNNDGLLEDRAGTPARFSLLTGAHGHTIRQRSAAVIQEQLRKAGLTVDVVTLDDGGIFQHYAKGDYDTIYYGIASSASDPGLNFGFWLSSGDYHFWNPNQAAPSTDWERRIDDLMNRQAQIRDLAERQKLFAEVQQIFVDEMPAIYLVAPKVTLTISDRVLNPRPAPQIPQLLWSAESLAARQ